MLLLSDVTSPLLGPTGAAAVFGPQKGATPSDIDLLERGLAQLHALLGGDADAEGAGAAGGTAYGLTSAWKAHLVPGAAAVAEAAGVHRALMDADLVVTGEGRFDATSLSGKVVGHLVREVSAAGPALAVVAGQAALSKPSGVSALLTLTDLANGTEGAQREPLRWLHAAGMALARDEES